MNRRALLIAYHFPPQAASSGIQRTLSFSTHLGRHGWEPQVLTATACAYSAKNSSQLDSLPPELVVRRAFALDTKRHLGILGRYPELLALPDRWISWWLSAVPLGLSMVRRYHPAVIWSTFPIATAPLIGLALHRLTGLPWVVDFRDPMLQPGYPATTLQRKTYAWIEREAILRCRAAVFTTHSAMSAYRRRFPEDLHDKFVVIENGYDEAAFDAAFEAPATGPEIGEAPLTLLHSGVLYADGRDPTALFEAIGALKAAGKLDRHALQVVLRATGDDRHFKHLAEECGVGDIVRIAPPVPYREALREMLQVDGLLVFQGTPFNTQVPAKIYEYFRARKPILGLLDPAGETARVLANAGFRDIVPMNSVTQIGPALERFISQVRRRSAYVAGDDVVASASRANRAAELARLFHRIAGDA